MSRIITATDVAKLAGVSQPTVSRAFSGSANLKPETRERVMRAAQELGYTPNALARSLASSRSGLIGLIVMKNESPFYDILVNMTIDSLRRRGYSTMLIRQLEEESGTETVVRALEYRVDAAIVTAAENTEDARQVCMRAGVPVILLNRMIDNAQVDTVICDNREAGKEIAKYLAGKGHRRIACITGESTATTTRERLEGILSGTQELGMEISQIMFGRYSYDSGRKLCGTLINEAKTQATAIVCFNDVIAFGAMDCLRYECGLRVPEDMSVMGFDDIAQTRWLSYNLTSMRQPYRELVDGACLLLERRLEDPDAAVTKSVYACFVEERGSVAETAFD